jgi:hypothetical protein
MGTFRTLKAVQQCSHCAASFTCSIQFKTGDDAAMPEHDVEDVVNDVAPGSYDGTADAFCPPCEALWAIEEKRAHFDCLALEVESGAVIARRATWRHGALGGRPELGLVVTLADEPPLDPDQIRALAEAPERGGWPNFAARLIEAGVTLWVGSDRITPGQPQSQVAHDIWWPSHQDAVAARLRARGWSSGDDQFREVAILITPGRRVRLG